MEINNILKKIGIRITREMREKLIAGDKIASEELIRSIRYEVTNGKLHIYMKSYGLNVNNGRRPFGTGKVNTHSSEQNNRFPPVNMIKKWIAVKGLPVKGNISRDAQAFLIARSIAGKGIKPFKFIPPNMNVYIDEMKKEIILEMKKAAMEQLKEDLKNTK